MLIYFLEKNYGLIYLATLGNKTHLIIEIKWKAQSFIPDFLCVLCSFNSINEWSIISSHTQGEVEPASRSPTGAVIAWLSLEGLIQQIRLRAAENQAAS